MYCIILVGMCVCLTLWFCYVWGENGLCVTCQMCGVNLLCSVLLTEAGIGQMPTGIFAWALWWDGVRAGVLFFFFKLYFLFFFCFKLIIDFYMLVFCITWWCCVVGDFRFLIIGVRNEEPVCHISCWSLLEGSRLTFTAYCYMPCTLKENGALGMWALEGLRGFLFLEFSVRALDRKMCGLI